MSFENKWAYILRYLSGESKDQEKQLVEKWMQEDTELKKEVQKLEKIWNAREEPLLDIDIEASRAKLKARIESDSELHGQTHLPQIPKIPLSHPAFQHTSPAYRWLRYAAMFIFAFMLSYFVTHGYTRFPWSPKTEILQSQNMQMIQVEKGKRMTVTLNDGTRIKLDAGSQLQYPEVFKDKRQVYLKGEAYFEVAHDSKRPFTVHARHAVVQVLGTKFNVRAWEDISDVTVAVKEGRVSLNHEDITEFNKVILTKGLASTLVENGQPSIPVNVDVEQYLSWMNHEMHFKNATVKEILRQLERWYKLEFQVKDPSLLNTRLSVHLKKTNVDDVLKIISALTDTRITKHDNIIELY